ncbi:hypothetical protein LguiB_028111 [Lonicera macranthoides]
MKGLDEIVLLGFCVGHRSPLSVISGLHRVSSSSSYEMIVSLNGSALWEMSLIPSSSSPSYEMIVSLNGSALWEMTEGVLASNDIVVHFMLDYWFNRHLRASGACTGLETECKKRTGYFWLLSTAMLGYLLFAFYFGARFAFDRADRKRLFNMINDLPTIFEVVTGAAKKQTKEESPFSNHSSSKSKTIGTKSQPKYPKGAPPPKDEEEEGVEEEEDEHGDALCGACRENYASDEFWICCDICEKRFHGKIYAKRKGMRPQKSGQAACRGKLVSKLGTFLLS